MHSWIPGHINMNKGHTKGTLYLPSRRPMMLAPSQATTNGPAMAGIIHVNADDELLTSPTMAPISNKY